MSPRVEALSASLSPAPITERRPFIPSSYVAQRDAAVVCLRRLIAAWCSDDFCEQARAVVEGDRLLRAMDQTWTGK